MVPLLYKYLTLHDHVSIPGIGHFTIERQPAKLDVEHNVIHPPLSTISYKNEKDVADKTFYSFLAKEMNIDVVEAIRQFQDFAFHLKNNISSRKAVELPSFGILKMVKDEIVFQPVVVSNTYYPPINIDNAVLLNGNHEALVSDEEYGEEEMQSKSYWWVWALILGAIGVGAIVYHNYFLQD
jgi:hypothetical protein